MSSMSGLVPKGGCAFNTAANFAVEGLSMSLEQEVRHLGIKVTVVEPGAYGRELLPYNSIRYAAATIDDYVEIVGSVVETIQRHR